MKDQHRATASEWACIRVRADDKLTYSCILELLHRVEALEAAQHAHVDLSHLSDAERKCSATRLHSYKVGKAEPIENWGKGHTLVNPPVYAEVKPNHPAKPDSSLVDRVSFAICPDGQGTGFRTEARQAIREIAAWLREQRPWDVGLWPSLLEQEAER